MQKVGDQNPVKRGRSALRHGPVRNQFLECIPTLLSALGWEGDRNRIADFLPTDRRFFDLDDLLALMLELRYKSHRFRGYLIDIEYLHLPYLYITRQGLRILLEAKGSVITCYNMASMKYEQMDMTSIQGVLIHFEYQEEGVMSLREPQEDWFMKLLGRFKKLYVIVFFTSLMVSFLTLVSPLLIMLLYSQMSPSAGGRTMIVLMGVVIYITGIVTFTTLRSYLLNYISSRVGCIVGNEVLRRLMYLPPSFTENSTLGSQINRLTDFENIKELIASPAAVALFDLPFVTGLIISMFILGGPLGFIPIVGYVAYAILNYVTGPFIRRNNVILAQESKEEKEFLIDVFTGARTVKFTTTHDVWNEKWGEIMRKHAVSSYRISKLNAVVSSVSWYIMTITGLVTIGMTVKGVIENNIPMVAMIALLMLTWKILGPGKVLLNATTHTNKIKKAIEQLDRFMNLVQEKRSVSPNLFQEFGCSISFSNVSFKYPQGSSPSLLGVNFKVGVGETLVITGGASAGKSTILKLMLGFYSGYSGTILMDDLNIQQLNPINLRRSISFIPKDPFFHDTIINSLIDVNTLVKREDIESACRAVGIWDEIMALPKKFATPLDRRTVSILSKTFLRRMNFARLLLNPSGLMIMDRPLFEMSRHHEVMLIEEIKKLQHRYGTLIIVSQNLSLFELADNILWLEHGRVKMFGDRDTVTVAYMEKLAG